MKKLTAIAIVLCSCATACKDKDTGKGEVWPRLVEPRLTGSSAWQPCRRTLPPGHVVDEALCGPKGQPEDVAASPEACDEIISNHAEAIRMLVSQPSCTDNAIAGLERFAPTDPGAMSDVAAAYYVRAQREDRPSDLLPALDAADKAVAVAPRLPAAHFNRALIQEALGFSAEAIVSWDGFRGLDSSPWAREALAHRNRLARERAFDAERQWALNRERLPAALRAGDRVAVAKLIAPFPSAAQRYLEEELLPQWAAAPSKEHLDEANIFAAEWSRVSDDRYALDDVEAMARSPELLRKGHLAFAEARRADHAFGFKRAAGLYKKAGQLLDRGGSPLRLSADLGYAVAVSFEHNAHARATALLDPIEQQARKRGYRALLERIHSTRGYFQDSQSRYVEGLAELDAALNLCEPLHDRERLAGIHLRKSGALRAAGQYELAWREALEGIRDLSHIVDPQSRHGLLGETAAAAQALGYPRIALLYQNEAVRLIQNELAAAPPEDIDLIRQWQSNLAVVLRGRAGIELHIEDSSDYSHAREDLDEAMRLADENEIKIDPNIRRILRSRVEEVQGQELLRTDPNRAAAAFTQALGQTSGELRTVRAVLFAQRADAQRRAGRNADAERDLRAALDELQTEESQNLENRRRGQGEQLWSAFFSRFRETYDLLIRQLIEEDQPAEAFAYAERARALEPLDLIGRHTTMKLAQIQASLPRGTFLVEYWSLEDRTYVWIVSYDRFAEFTLTVPRKDVDRWSAALQNAARHRDDGNFDAGLFAPFDRLLSVPLSAIGKEPDVRLVFVPDGAMHGLPFAALRNPVTRRHLIEDAPVSIAGSATLYVMSLRRDRALPPTSHPSALLVGDPAFNERLTLAHGLKRLPGALSEVMRIRPLYDPRADVCVDTHATVPEFLTRARDKTIVHFAGHAITNAQAPFRSLLLLAPSPQHSGALEAQELLTRLKLNQTRLVVLSTCSSAGGLPVGPEGVAPLVRPLIAAGVPAVIGSLWDVEDATAEELLVSFHRHYQQGSDAAVALQSAQLDLLRTKNPGLRSVLAWAPFEVIGYASSPFASPRHK